MFDWLKRLITPINEKEKKDNSQLLALQGQVQSLQLQLKEQETALTALRSEQARQKQTESAKLQDLTHSSLETVFSDLATPIQQLHLQSCLLETARKEIPTAQLMKTVNHLVNTLQDHGIQFEGQINEQVNYDPNLHNPLADAGAFSDGTRVTIRIPGVSFHGKILRRAGVALIQNEAG